MPNDTSAHHKRKWQTAPTPTRRASEFALFKSKREKEIDGAGGAEKHSMGKRGLAWEYHRQASNGPRAYAERPGQHGKFNGDIANHFITSCDD